MEIDPSLIPLLVVYAVVAVYLIWLFLTPQGKSYRAKNKEKAIEKAKRVADGTYRTDAKSRVLAFFSGVVIITAFTFLFGLFLASIDPYLWEGEELTFVILGVFVGAFFSLLAIGIGNIAEQKGRSFDAFFILSIIFSPLIMGIIAVSLAPINKGQSSTLASPASSDVAEQIKKLSDLMDQGILTKEEFEAKKQQLLDRI